MIERNNPIPHHSLLHLLLHHIGQSQQSQSQRQIYLEQFAVICRKKEKKKTYLTIKRDFEGYNLLTFSTLYH